MESGGKDDTPWEDLLSDFTLILDTGERIKCHKVVLAKGSPVLAAMLTTNMVEANTGEMNLTGYDLETVTTFLKYLYAQWMCLDPEAEIQRLNIPLLKLAHQYQVEPLKADCVANLKMNRDLDAALDIWTVARQLGIQELEISKDSVAWLANESGVKAFPVLQCGKCQVITEKPALKCDACNHLTFMKITGYEQPMVTFAVANQQFAFGPPATQMLPSTVSVKFPSSE